MCVLTRHRYDYNWSYVKEHVKLGGNPNLLVSKHFVALPASPQSLPFRKGDSESDFLMFFDNKYLENFIF